MKAWLVRVSALVVLSAALLSTCVASAASRDGFGNGGYRFVGGVTGLGVQRSGRIVFSSGFYVGALKADGADDRQFKSHDVSGGAECNDGYCFDGFAMQRDDRIVVAGQNTVFRLEANGALDTSFGTGGRAVLRGIRIQSVAPTTDGAILVAGAQEQPDGYLGNIGGEVRVARLLPSGAPDPSFGTGGRTSLDARVGWPVALGVQPDGGVIAVGLGSMRGSPVTRLRANGSLDTEFGESGVTTIALHDGTAMAIDPSGRILVGGLLWPTVSGSGLPLGGVVRLDSRGRPDPSFGRNGVATLREDRASGYVEGIAGLAIQPDGSVVAAGGSAIAACCNQGSYAYLAKFSPDGQSAHFEYAGSGLLDPDHECFHESASAVTVQSDANILVGGWVCDYGSWIARYGPDLRVDAGSPLRLHRTQPRGNAPVRATSATSLTRLTTTVGASAPARVTVSVRRATLLEGIPGKLVPIAGGTLISLLPGSSAGRTTLKRPAKTVAAITNPSGRVTLRLLLPRNRFPRGSWGIATVRAADTRGRGAVLEIEFVTR